MEKLLRINKYLSDAGVCSRRVVDELIKAGRVEVNAVPAKIGQQIDTTRDKVTVDGQNVNPESPWANAIDEKTLIEQAMRTPWWVEHNMEKEARLEALKQNPKSKLLRKGRKNANKKQVSVKLQASKLAEEARAAGKKVDAAKLAEEAKKAVRAENRRAKSFADAVAKLRNPAHDLKERRVEGVNPKAAALRGKKTATRRARRK